MSIKRLFFISLILFTRPLIGQDIDSIKHVDRSSIGHEERIALLTEIIQESVHTHDSIVKYGELLLESAAENEYETIYSANYYLGQAYSAKGNYDVSLKYLLDALKASNKIAGFNVGIINSLLGGLYGKLHEVKESRNYFLEGIAAFKKGGSHTDSISLVMAYNNFAESYCKNRLYDSALYYYQKALLLSDMMDLEWADNQILGNIGIVNLALENYDSAETQLGTAISFYGHVQNPDPLAYASFLIKYGELLMQKGEYRPSEEYLIEGLMLAEVHNLQEEIRDGSLALSRVFEETNKPNKALKFYKKYIGYSDSIENLETVKKIAHIHREYEVGQKQAEVDLLTAEQSNQRTVFIAVLVIAIILFILALIIFKNYRERSRTAKELSALNKTKDKFFSIISHDLRGPVISFHGIGFMIRQLVTSQRTDKLLEMVDDIDEAVRRLSSLLDDLLTWTMQQQGQLMYSPEKLNLKEMAEDLVCTLSYMAESKEIDLWSDIKESVYLWADKHALMSILRNLMSNSLKFTPEGGNVAIMASMCGNKAEIRVSDTGVGMPQDKLEKLFSFDTTNSTFGTSGEKGMGLGLQLVQEFVQMNGGSVSVASEEGAGTTFTLELPLYKKTE